MMTSSSLDLKSHFAHRPLVISVIYEAKPWHVSCDKDCDRRLRRPNKKPADLSKAGLNLSVLSANISCSPHWKSYLMPVIILLPIITLLSLVLAWRTRGVDRALSLAITILSAGFSAVYFSILSALLFSLQKNWPAQHIKKKTRSIF